MKSNRIVQTTVENVHYDKGMGVAEITAEQLKDFCKRNHPAEYEQFCEDLKENPENCVLDCEAFLTGMESGRDYATLRRVIAKQRIGNATEKGFLANFILRHQQRSHALLNSMVEFHEQAGKTKFEYFWELKHFLEDAKAVFQCIMTFVPGFWKVYRLSRDTFPLNDSPILVQPDSIMVALSPRLLLEIDRTKVTPESHVADINFITAEKLKEFRLRTIANTFREIIFGSSTVLEQWRATKEFADRHELMKDMSSYNKMVKQHGNRELWKINAYGGVDSGFADSWPGET